METRTAIKIVLLALLITKLSALGYIGSLTKRNTESVTKRNSECSSQELQNLLQECKESVTPGDTSIQSRFCGSQCKNRASAYADACNYPNFNVNTTGTCLVDSNHPQCVFALLLIRPGVVSCMAKAHTSNNETSAVLLTEDQTQSCSLTASHSTSDYFQINFDFVENQIVIEPPLELPWTNCTDYFALNSYDIPTIEVERTTDPGRECSQYELNEIVKDCEDSLVALNTSSSMSKEFCGENCRVKLADYASACNLPDLSLNITGSCMKSSTEVQCIFAVILLRPGISSCSVTPVDGGATVSSVDVQTLPCCMLQSTINITAEHFSIQPDPGTGLPVIQPPLVPPWDTCTSYSERFDYVCEETDLTTSYLDLTISSAPPLCFNLQLILFAVIFVLYM